MDHAKQTVPCRLPRSMETLHSFRSEIMASQCHAVGSRQQRVTPLPPGAPTGLTPSETRREPALRPPPPQLVAPTYTRARTLVHATLLTRCRSGDDSTGHREQASKHAAARTLEELARALGDALDVYNLVGTWAVANCAQGRGSREHASRQILCARHQDG